MLSTAVLQGVDGLERLAPEWRELVSASPSATPFQTLEWQQAWLRHFAGRARLHLIAVREGDDLVGLMPLFQTQGVWKALRAIGSGSSDYLHPLARAGYEDQVAAAVRESLEAVRGADLIDLHQIREDRPLSGMPDSYLAIEQARCLVLSLPKTYDEYLGMLGRSLRYDVRKLDKDLFRNGRASVEQVAPESIDSGMSLLFEMHRKRWRKRGLPGAFLGRAEAFHREWAHAASREGWLWLSLLKWEGETIGAIYAMTLGNACYYYQAGFDPDKGSISPGTLLVANTIRRAIDEGKETFDFLRGDEPYKMRWKAQRTLTNSRYLRAVTKMPGGLGLRWNGAGSVVESRVRARLEGRGLL